MAQPISRPRCSRTARPNGVPSDRPARAGPGRVSRRPPPKSRCAISRAARASRSAVDAEQQRAGPPALVAEGVHALRPPERGEPDEGVVLHRPDAAHQVPDGDRGAGQAERPAGRGGELDGDQRDGGVRHPEQGQADAVREAAVDRQPGPDHGDGGDAADEHRGRDAVDQPGEGGGVAAQDGGAEQLGPSGLLLGAGVPHDEEHDHAGRRRAGRPGRSRWRRCRRGCPARPGVLTSGS